MKDFLVDEQKFYDTHKAELVQKYLGKVLVIHHDRLAGVFNGYDDAFNFTLENKFPMDTFMVKKVVKKEPVYTMIPTLIQIEGDEVEGV